MIYQCPRCKERGQTWIGDPPICGFDKDGNFLKSNWNCATLNALRQNLETNVQCNDYNVGVLSRTDVGFGILTWYKNRGRTDSFTDQHHRAGTLHLAQLLLGDIEPNLGWDDLDPDWDTFNI